MKKEFACNGHVVHSADSDEEDSPAPGKKDEHGKVLQFQGDQRASVKQFLVQSGLLTEKEAKDQIVMCVGQTIRGDSKLTSQPRLLDALYFWQATPTTYTFMCNHITSSVPVVFLSPSTHAFDLLRRHDGAATARLTVTRYQDADS